VPIDFTEKTRLAEKICGGSHRNIVGLLGKGYSENLQYYMQMEECDLSLEEYVNHGKVAHRLLAWPTHPWPTDNFEHTNKQNQRVFIIVAILQQILSGLVHIHKHKTIHGNLHPRNGNHVGIDS
jgi:serine/threonine protein kinase